MSEDNLVEYIETVMKIDAGEAMGNIKKQMDTIITTSLKVTGENVKAKKGCFVSLGFDFMLDQDLKVYLIEVNVSPAMDESTEITARMVKEYQEGLNQLFFDYDVFKPKASRNTEAKIGRFVALLEPVGKKKQGLTKKKMNTISDN